MSTPALQIKDLHAWYGESHILHGVDLTVNRGEVVTLLGRNGAGRTTTLRAIMGLVGTRKGSIVVHDDAGQGVETIGLPTHRIAIAASAIARRSAASSPACRARRTCCCRRCSRARWPRAATRA